MSAHASHAERAAAFGKDVERLHWHDQALWFVRVKRDRAVQAVPEWEALRDLASRIKAHTLARLPDYLESFEKNARAAGAVVHFAPEADDANRIVLELLQERGVTRVVKSKSMLTEECGLNPYLEERGIEVIDTDLGERIVQLRHEPPSHIVLPAIHIRKEEVGELFHARLGTDEGMSDPEVLTRAARKHLREKFLAAQAGISGVNFAVAETGTLVVCTNEGNADLGTSLPPLHIACVGIDKVVPRTKDVAVFVRLLARSATGQPISTYTSHFHGPRPDGELHIVVVDAGRSRIRKDPDLRRALTCIRCGACLNTCPVFRRSGGHSYGTSTPGPIGSVLAPARDAVRYASLPYASTLCGSCTDVCPVKVDLAAQLYRLRQKVVEARALAWTKRVAMALGAWVLRSRRLYEIAGRIARALGRLAPFLIRNAWGRSRALPALPKRSFRDLYDARGRDGR